MDKSSVESYLRFLNYTVNKVNFELNDNFDNNGQKIRHDFNIGHSIEIEDNKMLVTIQLNVFPNMKENNYPFSIDLEVSGLFQVSGDEPEKYEINALAILYPYLRSLVSTYTANSNVSTLVLPPINIKKYIDLNNESSQKEQG